jgi:tetratricopeptide (TPR) repeat protein
MEILKRGPAAAVPVLAALLLAAYANHFSNGFHFDDSHAIVDNVFVRDLRYVPRYFTDATTFSVLPLNQSYRPLLQTTFAVDYWLGGGYKPVVFQADTFLWYILLLIAIGRLYLTATGRPWIALPAVAIFALHPVAAETVNYVVQRGDLLSTLGVVGALDIYARWPAGRRRGWYLVPFVGAVLAKPPALIFPVLLALYVRLFERRSRIVRAIAPSVAIALVLAWWLAHNNPPTASTGASSPARYLWTQPFVALRYFGMFFVPVGLSADNDWPQVAGPADVRVAIGVAFLLAILGAAWRLRARAETRAIAFGLAWFVVALLPTSLTPLAEVANDHRMFFPFVGLALAATLAAERLLIAVVAPRRRIAVAAVALVAIVTAETVAVHARNEVWRSEETLWRDVTEKSPGNGRGWMNYGVALMARGEYLGAVAAFERALPLTPNYHLLEINLGVALGELRRPGDAERHFLRALTLQPLDWRSHVYMARWLSAIGRKTDALAHAQLAAELNPADIESASLAASLTPFGGSAEYFLSRSLAEYQVGRYRECIDSANRALALRPGYAEAFNNIAAAHNALGEWDAGIAAGEQAVRLNPGLQVAQNNLNYARQQKRRQ